MERVETPGERSAAESNPRPRLDELGIGAGKYARGPLNAITDVPGVRIGQSTIISEQYNTGVTAIVPDQLTNERRHLPAALAVGNGYGKLVGATQLQELGAIETPILLTSTLSAFRVADALVAELLTTPAHEKTTTLNPVVGETNDGALSAIRDRPVGPEHVAEALAAAVTGPVAEGCVGAGTGTTALGFKGGIGTSSRRVSVGSAGAGAGAEGAPAPEYTVGAIVQSNFTGMLRIAGVPMPAAEMLEGTTADTIGNSCMIVVATDAPLESRQLERLARRAAYAMRGVGADYDQGSGDYAIAFSVADPAIAPNDNDLSPMFHATMLAVEEALINSILRATTAFGPTGRAGYEIPIEEVRRRLAAAGATALN
ncbi:P1 family peptidase [Leucobacter sp. cx-328]|uniref:P1 family peptidase n=1 Tax=unclassified Leucobacter TaxID=2621730 RepID=UPI00165DE8BA|nr:MULTISPECIES: P1 family peptidase [unclassified Leucobacter]MBC9943631.1 P1 family peptidase [Leucobacter sp. cx-328]